MFGGQQRRLAHAVGACGGRARARACGARARAMGSIVAWWRRVYGTPITGEARWDALKRKQGADGWGTAKLCALPNAWLDRLGEFMGQWAREGRWPATPRNVIYTVMPTPEAQNESQRRPIGLLLDDLYCVSSGQSGARARRRRAGGCARAGGRRGAQQSCARGPRATGRRSWRKMCIHRVSLGAFCRSAFGNRGRGNFGRKRALKAQTLRRGGG